MGLGVGCKDIESQCLMEGSSEEPRMTGAEGMQLGWRKVSGAR